MRSVDLAWTATAAILVYFMHGGFGFYESGMCRSKNTVDTLSHNLFILATTVLVYWAVGFGLMYGRGNGLIGTDGFFPSLLGDNGVYPRLPSTVPLPVAFAFVLSFADTPATLIAGSGAERIRFGAVLLLTTLISGAVFPIVGHWILGGGWLAVRDLPVYDTGSGAVHLCGGSCAFVVAALLGPRAERDECDTGDHGEPVVSSMPQVFLGGFVLWLGFFGFNTGFAMHVGRDIGLIVVNTALAGCAAALAGLAGEAIATGKAKLRTAIVAVLAANAAVTSPSGVIEPWAAACLGAGMGALVVISIRFWPRLRIDDPTEYLTMNLVGGFVGMVSVGLLASPRVLAEAGLAHLPQPGLLYGGGAAQLAVQFLAAVSIIGFVLPALGLACGLLRAIGKLRVPVEEEIEGADEATHGEHAEEDRPGSI